MRDKNLRRCVHRIAIQLGMLPIGFAEDEKAAAMDPLTVAEAFEWSGVNERRLDAIRRDVDLILKHLGVEVKTRDRGPSHALVAPSSESPR